MKRPAVGDMLEKYARKAVQEFVQIDVFRQDAPDSVSTPDADGHAMFGGINYDLRTDPAFLPVRVQLDRGASRAEILRALKKVRRWVKQDWEALRSDRVGVLPPLVDDDPLLYERTPEGAP